MRPCAVRELECASLARALEDRMPDAQLELIRAFIARTQRLDVALDAVFRMAGKFHHPSGTAVAPGRHAKCEGETLRRRVAGEFSDFERCRASGPVTGHAKNRAHRLVIAKADVAQPGQPGIKHCGERACAELDFLGRGRGRATQQDAGISLERRRIVPRRRFMFVSHECRLPEARRGEQGV